MHYKVFAEAMKMAQEMPHEDLVVILAKPETTNRQADLAWRKTCARNGVDTSPLGSKTSDPERYERNYAAAERLQEAKAKIEKLETDLRTAMTKLALYKVTNR
jgi:hypothetical protein